MEKLFEYKFVKVYATVKKKFRYFLLFILLKNQVTAFEKEENTDFTPNLRGINNDFCGSNDASLMVFLVIYSILRYSSVQFTW